MSQIKNKSLDNDDETLQAILRAVISVQRETGFGSIEITVHEGRVTQIEKREKIRIIQDKSEKQGLDRQNPDKLSSHKQGVETLSINKEKRELSTALHN